MQQSIYRTLLIWVVIIAAIFNVVPTIGWMTLDDDARTERLERWKQEDIEQAKDRPGYFARQSNAFKRWIEFDRDQVINLGLDLQGGLNMVVSFDWEDLPDERKQEFYDEGFEGDDIRARIQEQVVQQIRRRVNEFEAKEPVIQALGQNQVQIQLPGEQDIQRAVDLIKKTAQLNFHIVSSQDEIVPLFQKIKAAYSDEFDAFINRPEPGRSAFRVAAENYEGAAELIAKAEADGLIPEDKIIAFSQPPQPYATDQQYLLYVLDKEPLASGEGLTSAGATPDPSNPPNWMILFNFNNAAGAEFGRATQANINRAMAIVIDDAVISAPVIRDRIGASGTITGNFQGNEARDLAIALDSGSMVVPVKEEFVKVVGPTLGAESVRAGVTSALGGIALVGVFMLVYYMVAGFVAVVSLALNALFVVALMSYFDMTLTLPGIAGLILTVGMAVDANVLIFERIREERRLGHSLKSSVENGFQRATVTILDANVTTLLAAMVLFQFGSGPIQGFAVTLSIGVVTSVFTALVVTRALFDLIVERGLVESLPMLSIVKPDTKIPFLSGRKPAAAISAVLIIAGLAFFGMRSADNFGVDFTEGTKVDLNIVSDAELSADDVRALVVDAGFDSPAVQRATGGGEELSNEFMIRVADIDTAPAEESVEGEASEEAAESEEGEEVVAAVATETVDARLRAAVASLSDAGDVSGVEVLESQTVGPAVGAQLRWDALQSIFYSLLFIIIYLTFRFELKFAVGAVIALAHDVLFTLGVYSVLGREISLPVVAAVLTIIGYSLNDTIVVFDRIREDLQVYRGKGLKLLDIINISINETLGRTLLTSITTLFVVLVLFLFGGAAINDFALVLIIGVAVGTYSSIFIASAAVWLWTDISERRHMAELEKEGAKKAGKKKKSKKKGDAAPAT